MAQTVLFLALPEKAPCAGISGAGSMQVPPADSRHCPGVCQSAHNPILRRSALKMHPALFPSPQPGPASWLFRSPWAAVSPYPRHPRPFFASGPENAPPLLSGAERASCSREAQTRRMLPALYQGPDSTAASAEIPPGHRPHSPHPPPRKTYR